MNVNHRISYYLLLLIFPISFLLHGINENFGLIGFDDLTGLLVNYSVTGISISLISLFIFGKYNKAFVFSFIIMTFYFLFGVFKDSLSGIINISFINSYRFQLPFLLVALLLLVFFMRRNTRSMAKTVKIICYFLIINLVFEAGWLFFNLFAKAERKLDFGDSHHHLIKGHSPSPGISRPVVFWFVFDEYAASSTLEKVWQFRNPLDSVLRGKGFFVADSAVSNYNFTHYSISSTLDMIYLNELVNHSIVTLKDLARGAYAIDDNNVLQMFEKAGYSIQNFSIFQLQNHPTKGSLKFKDVPASLVHYQTMSGRIRADIGWNFINIFEPDKRKADSLNLVKTLYELDSSNKRLIENSLQAIQNGANTDKPAFYMYHFMLPHEPYMYNADGSVNYGNGYSALPDHYINHLQYTNSVVTRMIDAVLTNYRQKNIVIILQGDHGFKFVESDSLYDSESCKILYAIYCSDREYGPWYNSMSSVNGFRIFFNKYFKTNFSLLPDTSYSLFYR